METSPVSSASNPGPLNTVQLTELSAENANIRFSLGHSIVQDFAIYRDILDEHHERRERIIKVSRDINNFSKKMIFALHRAEPKDYLPQFSATSEALIEFREKHAIVLKLLHRASVDLQGSNYHRYQRSISGAMQEYIEAMTLEYYLIHGKLMPKSALEADLLAPIDALLTLDITDEDYLLGVADLTGELMRLAINTLGQSLTSLPARDLDSIGGTLLPTPEERVQNILLFLRDLKSGFDGLAHTKVSPVWKKMGAFKQSLNKIEMACYNVKVRGAEYPPEILRQMLMSGSDIGGGSGGSAGGDAGNDEEE
ncbi:Translin [Dissophora ornata]|nr:Translin [Dissophora ornata]